jgi:tetratricopeptide (TPR) repeat protein
MSETSVRPIFSRVTSRHARVDSAHVISRHSPAAPAARISYIAPAATKSTAGAASGGRAPTKGDFPAQAVSVRIVPGGFAVDTAAQANSIQVEPASSIQSVPANSVQSASNPSIQFAPSTSPPSFAATSIPPAPVRYAAPVVPMAPAVRPALLVPMAPAVRPAPLVPMAPAVRPAPLVPMAPAVQPAPIVRQAPTGEPPLTNSEKVVRALVAAGRYSLDGTANLKQGKFDEAERLFIRALDITEACLGTNNNGVTKAMEILATFYLTRGSYQQAEPLLRRLYSIRLIQHRKGLVFTSEFSARENYLLLALTVEKCSSCLEKLNMLAQSEKIYLILLKRQEESFGHEHSFTLNALERLGEFYLRARVYGLAQVVFEKLYDTKSKLHGPFSIEVSSVLSNLSLIYNNLGMFCDQVAVLERQVFLLDTLHGGAGLSLASALTRLADALSNAAKENRDEELSERAALIYRRALTIYERHYGPCTPTVVSLRNRLKSLS